MMSVAELQAASKIYKQGNREISALKNVSLKIQQGEFAAVLGPSGSGKSTLIHLIGCLDRPTSGRVLFRDCDLGQLSNARLAYLRNRNIGFVFQTFYLLSRYRALENVMLPLLYRGLSRSERRALAEQALLRVGLESRMTHRPTELSGGECQRVAIARAIVNQPDLLLADEPTGNLDRKTGLEIIELFSMLNQETGTTVVLVTHDEKLAAFCHRRLILHDGAIQAEN